MVQISLQNSGGKVVFYGGVPRNPPLGTNGSKSTLVTEVLKQQQQYYVHEVNIIRQIIIPNNAKFRELNI